MAKRSNSKSFTIKNVRNRIKELRYVKASELNANPKNWRKHPDRQKSEMAKILSDIGFAGALVAREDMFGSLILIDGHMRADMASNEQVPVLVLDVTQHEADRLLAMMDPIAAMAETDKKAYDSLLDDLERAERESMRLLDEFNSKMNEEVAFNEEMYRREKEYEAVGPELLEPNERAANMLNIPVIKDADSHIDDDFFFELEKASIANGRDANHKDNSSNASDKENRFLGVMRPGSVERTERDPVMRLGRVLSPVPRPVYHELIEFIDKYFQEDVKAGLAEVLTLGIECAQKRLCSGEIYVSVSTGDDGDDVPF